MPYKDPKKRLDKARERYHVRKKDPVWLAAKRAKDQEASRIWRMSPEGKAYMRAYSKRRANHLSAAARRRKYGLDDAAYAGLVARAGGRCEVCRRERPLVIDHDHETKRVRGLLCASCNRGLGYFGDSVSALNNAAEYLCR